LGDILALHVYRKDSMKKHYILFIIFIVLIVCNSFGTDTLDNDSERIIYFRSFFSNIDLLHSFSELITDGYIWNRDTILLGSLNGDGSFNGQAQFYFTDSTNGTSKILIINFLKTIEGIKILEIYISD